MFILKTKELKYVNRGLFTITAELEVKPKVTIKIDFFRDDFIHSKFRQEKNSKFFINQILKYFCN